MKNPRIFSAFRKIMGVISCMMLIDSIDKMQ